MNSAIQMCEKDLLNSYEGEVERAEYLKDELEDINMEGIQHLVSKCFTIEYELSYL